MNASKRRILAVVAIAAAATTLPIASPAGAGGPNGRVAKAAETRRRSSSAQRARAGDLDPNFRGDGKISTNFGSGEEARDVAIQADGKIGVAGFASNAIALARYTTEEPSIPVSEGTAR
jgi:hypothetical protein